jgi:hypothetical protein
MREITTNRKLSLTKTTLRTLTSAELSRVAGGILEPITEDDCHGHGTTMPRPSEDVPCSEPPPPPPPPFTTRTFVTGGGSRSRLG